MTRRLLGASATAAPWSRRTLAAGAVAAVLAGAAACGDAQATGSSASPSTELRSAVTELGHAQVMAATVKMGGSPAQLRDFAKATGGQLPPRVAKLISGAKAVIEVKAPDGKTLSDLKGHSTAKGKSRFALTVDGDQVVRVRSLAQKLYLRADVDKIAQLVGKPGAVDQLRSQVPHDYAWAQAGLSGKWVSVDLKALKDLAGGALRVPSPSPSATADLMRQLRHVLKKDVTVRRAGQASGGADHLVLTGNIRTIGRDLLTSIRKITPGAANAPIRTENLPNKRVHLNAYVDGGTLKSISLNLGQFAGGKDAAQRQGKKIPLRVDFAKSGQDIEAPGHATPVDLHQLAPLFNKLGQSHASASSTAVLHMSASAFAPGSAQ
jgi:hypothetical protein